MKKTGIIDADSDLTPEELELILKDFGVIDADIYLTTDELDTLLNDVFDLESNLMDGQRTQLLIDTLGPYSDLTHQELEDLWR